MTTTKTTTETIEQQIRTHEHALMFDALTPAKREWLESRLERLVRKLEG
jgi:hypothetical protein